MTTTTATIARHEVDQDNEVVTFFVRFPGYVSNAENNGVVWDLIDGLEAHLGEWTTKDGYLHGNVNGCGPDEIKATKGLKWMND